ncbi:hypothetical protein RB595_001672 [Gaeumannomyces hyphopodioides]
MSGASPAPSPSLADQDASQAPQASPNTPIDMAVNFMLPKEHQSQDDFTTTAMHDMDVKCVQTAASDMCEGDTMILLNIPQHKANRTCSGGRFPLSYRLRFASNILRNCGFDLFPRLLDDKKYQARIRASLMAKELVPDGIEYILDLGPSSDDDLRSSHLETLTLSKGLMRWFRTATVPPRIDKALVSGHDDSCECALSDHPSPSSTQSPPAPQLPGCLWDDLGDEPRFRNAVEDYCEVRHTANVIRLLRRILGAAGVPGGGQLILDSAPRVFTIAGLTKLFELNYSEQSTWLRCDIRTWFLTGMNKSIVEILAEDAIVMGYSVKIPEVTRAAYRILASEHALQIESSSPPRRGGQLTSVFGRPLRDINNDAIQTAIEHGGQALAERVLGIVAHLRSDKVFDWLDLDEWRKFKLLEEKATSSLGTEPMSQGIGTILDAYRALKEALLGFIRERVQDALCIQGELGTIDSYTESMKCFTSSSQRAASNGAQCAWGFSFLWDSVLNDNQKALTSVFWRRLGTRWPAVVHATAARHIEFVRLARELNDALNRWGFNICDYIPEYFDIVRLFGQLEEKMSGRICAPMWASSSDEDYSAQQFSARHHFTISSHMLLGLNDDEMRFLPLWADGLNDGSGGVYDIGEVPPPMSGLGPSGPGPSFHTGQTVGTETTNSTVSDLGLGDMDIQSYTTETQTFQAHRDTSSAIPSSGGPGASEDMDFNDARYAEPADHQPIGQAIPHTVEALGQSPRTSGPNPLTGANLRSLDDSDMQYIFGGSDDGEGEYRFDNGSATPTGSVTDTMEVDRSSDSDWTMT